MIYVALLRGINVGGNNKIDMKDLKVSFENAGMHNVATYINSGNIIFSNEIHDQHELPDILEATILQDFNLDIRVLIRSFEEIEAVIDHLPDNWRNDKERKSDVLFLWEEIDNRSVLDELKIRPDIEQVIYIPGAILWSMDRKDLSKSGMSKIVGTKVYKKVTIRNVNTVRKIHSLMNSVDR
ncbi:DUF1697 domain-containing protein [Salinicoccus sp. ID82-1]|uniref:DUF1697 domain-containing protein n=1 Tax=Salinicoccus sp. ID82-1 TaxID=2820269 RepID=UPI001F33E7C4|nr:DUF1697 domain-containing protein [Salinicoccus sp. ID82-1]MCG1010871.1 DUF1697 domain-containing protein [Salinicoccus sp. ID82-1]